jgi:hypothetical protein
MGVIQWAKTWEDCMADTKEEAEKKRLKALKAKILADEARVRAGIAKGDIKTVPSPGRQVAFKPGLEETGKAGFGDFEEKAAAKARARKRRRALSR